MPDPIQSLHNPRVKQAIRLREAPHRRASGLMIIDGLREVKQALLGGVAIQQLFVTEDPFDLRKLLEEEPSDRFASETFDLEKVITLVSKPVFAKLAFGDRNDRVVAVAKQPAANLAAIPDGDSGLVLVIDRVEKPGNLGAMVRTADAAGATAVLLSDPICDLWNPNAIRASLGAIFRLPMGIGTADEVIEWLRARQYQMVAARVDGTTLYREVAWSRKTAIIVGSEAHGLGTAWNHSAIEAVRLPMRGTVDSLNVSVSAAILLYEATFARNP